MNKIKPLSTKNKSALVLIFITFIFILYFISIPLNPLWLPDETRYAEISREMVSAKNWFIPRLLELRYHEKPVVGYWLNNLGQLILGHNNIGVRISSAISTFLTAYIVFRMSMEVRKDFYQAITATLIYLSTFIIYSTGTYAVLDPAFTLWVTLSLATFRIAEMCAGNHK
ncbi:phospholipid carrier-dependent glycosyltransferase [Enterobacter asburiae]|uniref:phospholipid carrier-dependent glycosyltransferase n=1 Tax=Enterobacter asburiae TaxID=61645 RepID=UPI002879CEAF|nr:phospholipid carrier-dependent glycosyltransferase [Enterobacter asburiae]MDS1916215.1 phospholipid carrier-dependent glycosyltransferase [Enterobacter asburiae]